MKKLQKIYINSDNAILVVVDVENEFCKPGGRLYNETSARVVPGMFSSIQNLLGKARNANIPVIYVQSVRRRNQVEYAVFGVSPHLLIGSWNSEICDEVKPRTDETIVQKFSHDPFFKPKFDKILKKLVPDPTRCYAIVTGGNIHICVYHTVMGFHLRNYWTIVPIDSVYYSDDEGYKRAIDQFSEGKAYSNVFLSRSDLIEVSNDPLLLQRRPVPGT